jgi:4-amino-4-deoxy-L-arabinose transferase-like glycosyltransferase
LLGILVLALLPRLIHLDSSPLGRHAWRQSDTASVARNFHENGHRLFYPQIDWAVPGYVEMEFPIYPWVTALGYSLLGEAHWIARGLAVFGSLLAILFLFLILRRILSETAGLWGAFFLALLPLSLYFGRAIMPESWMLAASAAGIYWFLRWCESDSWSHYALSVVAITLACLLKLTSLYLGLPLLWLAWQRYGSRALWHWKIWLHALLASGKFDREGARETVRTFLARLFPKHFPLAARNAA